MEDHIILGIGSVVMSCFIQMLLASSLINGIAFGWKHTLGLLGFFLYKLQSVGVWIQIIEIQ